MNTENKNDQSSGKEADDSIALDLNFVPDWARKPPQTNYFNQSQKYKEHEFSDKQRKPRGKGEKRSSGAHRDRRRSGTAKGRDHHRRDNRAKERPRRRERVDIPEVDVRFFPAQKAIAEIARKIKSTKRAYPMMQIACLYLDNPEYCVARVETKKEAKDLVMFQCRICGMIAINEETINRHMVQAHMLDHMDKEERREEPPKGNFACIAQCGYSGILLGPPNHHSYTEKIKETHSSRFSNMSLEKYTSNIKTIHDTELMEKWKEEYSQRTGYRVKGKDSEELMTASQAEAYFLGNIARNKIQKTRRATLPVPLCREISDMGLQLAVKNAWMRESRFPASIMTALRGAFLSKGLAIFRTKKSKDKGKGITFVTPTKFSPIEIDHVVDSIKEVLLYLKDNPGSSRSQMIKALRPEAQEGSEEIKEIISPLSWLIDKGHIIEFFDGTLSVPK